MGGVHPHISRTPEPPYTAVIFTSSRNPGDHGYEHMSTRMDQRAREQPGYLGHESMLYRDLTVRQNLQFHARLHGVDPAQAERALAAVGLAHRADDPVRELSRGMVQRAAVARATLHDPKLLLLDEPRANLDPAAAEALEPLIGKPSGRTRVIASHDVESALAEADLALGLKAGRQVFAGTTDVAAVRELYR